MHSVAILCLVLLVGIRYPGVLLAGIFFTFYSELISGLQDVTTAYAIASIAAVLLHPTISGPIRLQVTAIDLSFAAFAIYHATSALWAPDTMLGAKEAVRFLTSSVAVYLLAKLIFSTNEPDRRFLEFAIALCALGTIMPALLNQIGSTVFGRFRLDDDPTGNIAVGLTQSLVVTALAAVTLVPAALKGHKLLVALPLAALVSAFPFLFSTGTRGGFLGLSVGLAVLALSLRGGAVFLLLVASVAMVPLSAGWLLDLVNSTESAARIFAFDTYIDPNNASIADRLELFASAIDIFADQPLFGIGMGGVTLAAGGYPHNFFLEVAAGSGLLGVALATSVAIFSIASVIRYRMASIPFWGPFLIAILISGFAQQQVSFSLVTGKPLYLIGIISGLAAAAVPPVRMPSHEARQTLSSKIDVRKRQPQQPPPV